MEAVCVPGDTKCEVNALAAALHSLHLYCTVLTATLIHCCSRFAIRKATTTRISWRWQNTRGIANLVVGATWCFSAAGATLMPEQLVSLVAAVLSPLSWLAATWLHGTLWQRKSSSPILYLCLYWLLSAAISAAMMCYYFANGIDFFKLNVYLHALSFIFCMILAAIDGICFFGEITNRVKENTNNTKESPVNYTYKHLKAYFYSKITFFWINTLLRKGFKTPLELEDLGELPLEECSERHYLKFKNIFDEIVANNSKEAKNVSMWKCYLRVIWPNFYISGFLKLLGDLMGLVPPLGLSLIVQYIVSPSDVESSTSNVEITLRQFLSNGYIMIVIITISAIGQALLSQNSTHLVSVEGIRLKTALQSMIFDKCMRLAPWAASINTSEEKEPLLNVHDESPKQIYTGLLTNLVSQDTYNVMSCVWICHYLWAIPLKVLN